MQRLLPSLLLAFALAAPALGKEFKLPEESPKLSIQVPDEWKTEKTDAGFDTQNKDHTVYLVLESADNQKDFDKLVDAMFVSWKEQGKKVDPAKGQNRATEIFGAPAKEVTWDTADEHGPLTVKMTSFKIDGAFFLLSQSIAKEADRASVDKMKKTVASLAPVGGAKSLGAALTGAKEAAPAEPAATPAPAKPAPTEAPAVASAKPSAPAEPPPAAKAAAGPGTDTFPKENPILSFKKPASWAAVMSPSERSVLNLKGRMGPSPLPLPAGVRSWRMPT